jgi:phytoene desaturase
MKHVIVIGAGFGGLSAAAHLAQNNYRVTVLEATDQPGGRARVVKNKGYTFDLGPSWYLMPDVFEEWFSRFGHKPSDFYELTQLKPSYKVFEQDQQFDVNTAPEVFELFERLEPGSAKKLKQLLGKTAQEYQEVRSGLLALDGLQLRQGLRPDVLRFLLRPELARSYHSRIKQYIQNPSLQHVLEFMTVFMGGSPANVPAYYSLLTHVDMGLGVWYPQGGFGAVARAFESVAREMGASFTYNKPVTRIEAKDGVVAAVWCGDERIACDAVVANADYHFVETQLLEPKDQSYTERYWSKRQLAPSGLIVTAGVTKKLPNLLHHNLFFDVDWDRHFNDVFVSKQWSDAPLFYLCAPSKSDRSVAPEGHENLFFLAPMAAGVKPSAKQIETAVQNMLSRTEAAIDTSFTADIEVQESYTSQYFEQTFNAYLGNAFGLSHTMFQSAVLRPRLQSKKLANLYYSGQFTNPGTGVPMVIQSGEITAKLIAEHTR